ncbi:MAG: sugar phosphate isomerase/epimerase, partial [Chitinophagaceae bacterium]|nr:sugar phosphate isomerase/epimerase [Chitinophagaceae bacterium]
IEQVFAKSDRYGLKVILQHYDTYEADFEKHKHKYAQWFEKIRPFKPYLINTQTGKDFFSLQQNLEIVDIAGRFSIENNIPLAHETHRNKFSFSCHTTFEYLKAAPGILLTLDISHWVNVAESFLEDQEEAVDLALSRTAHIHSRVGYPEGPQIPDPRDPQWSHAVEAHCNWWDKIVAQKKREDPSGVITITPEFGPYPYMINLPLTQQPIANQWDVNLHMMHLLRKRYQS